MSEYPTDDASMAMRGAQEAADNVARLLDRYWGDAGSDPDLIDGWRERLTALAFEIVREIGEPAERTAGGGLVKRAFLDVYRKP